MCGAKPGQAKLAAALKSLVTFKFDSAIHLWFVCQDIPIILLSSRPIRKLISRLCPLSESVFRPTRVYPRDVVCYRSQVQTRKPSATVIQSSTSQCCLKQCLRLETNSCSLLLTLSSFSPWSVSRLSPNLIILLAKTGGIYNYTKVVIDTFLFFPNI